MAQRIEMLNSFVSNKTEEHSDIKAFSIWKVSGEKQEEEQHPVHRGTTKSSAGVGSTTLDRFCKERKLERVDLIKIDTDGHEFEVFNGAKDCIANYRPQIIFEVGQYVMQEKGIDFLFYLDYFNELNYELIDSKTGRQLNEENCNQLIPVLGTTDAIAVPL